jgi:ArsR family transcriptional regulator, arsenate/arsenite/antimonite-responsive transcriptional repressor
MHTRQAIGALGSLAHETRLGIFRLLVRRGPQGLAAGTIADRLGVAPPTLSFHLTHMMHAGLIEQRRESRSLIYSANFGSMHALVNYLTENCCGEQADDCPAAAAQLDPPPAEPQARRAGAK